MRVPLADSDDIVLNDLDASSTSSAQCQESRWESTTVHNDDQRCHATLENEARVLGHEDLPQFLQNRRHQRTRHAYDFLAPQILMQRSVDRGSESIRSEWKKVSDSNCMGKVSKAKTALEKQLQHRSSVHRHPDDTKDSGFTSALSSLELFSWRQSRSALRQSASTIAQQRPAVSK